MAKKPSKPSSTLRTKDGKPYKVPALGSLGLLALGYRGVMAWRARKRELFLEQRESATKKDNE